MKKKTKTVALLAVLSLMATGCQKENNSEFAPEMNVSVPHTMYTIQYCIDGVQHRKILHSEADRKNFIRWLFTLAKGGSTVVFCDETKANQPTAVKEVVTYTTTNEDDAIEWAHKMLDKGYKVSIFFDEENKVFICIARL